jgi:peptidyl-prolyl cis-trans isomerase C
MRQTWSGLHLTLCARGSHGEKSDGDNFGNLSRSICNRAISACETDECGMGHMAQRMRAGRWVCVAWIAGVLVMAGQGGVERAVGQAAPASATSPAATPASAKADPSPFAPGDLKRPIFDTKTPVYNLGNVQAKSADTTVAEVDGRAITLGDVADAIATLPPSMKMAPFAGLFPGILNQLIRQEALAIGAQRAGLEDNPEVKRRIKAATDHLLADEYLQREVGAKITEQALLDLYNRDIAGKPGPEEVHVRVMLVPTEQQAQDIIAQLGKGADFATVSKEQSRDTTASTGGDLGFLARSGLNPEVGAVAFATPPGSVSPYPVLTGSGWFVVKVDARRRAPTPGFFEVRDRLRQTLLHEQGVSFVQRSLDSVTVRQYDISGKEADSETTIK